MVAKNTLRLVVAAATIAVTSAWAGMGVDPATITYKDWGAKKPNVTVILSHTGQKQPLLGNNTSGDFLWEGSEEMTKAGMDLYRRNNWTPGDPSSGTGFLRYAIVVRERYLGPPDGLMGVLRTTTRGGRPYDSLYFLTQDHVRNIPFGAKKVLYLSIAMALIRQGTEAIIVSFDDISDEDLRRISYEEAVLRHLKYRED